MVIKDQSCFFKRGIRIRIAFRTGIGRLVVFVRIFAVVNRLYANVGRIASHHIFRGLGFHPVHFHNLRLFRRTGPVQIGHCRFFPGVTDDAKTYNLDLGFGDTVIQLAHPKPTELGFRQNRQIIICRRRNNRIVLVQRNTPPSPTIPQFLKIHLVGVGQVDTITDKADVLIQRPILVDIFGIVGTFTSVVFGSVNLSGRIAFVFQIVIIIVTGNIVCRSIHITLARTQLSTFTGAGTAIPHRVKFIETRQAVKALVMKCRSGANIIFTVILAIRSSTVNRKVFTDKAQIQVERAHISARHHFDVLHIAQVMVILAVRAHDTTPGISGQIVICTQGHLEHSQMLVVHIGISHRRINVLVQFSVVAMPNEFTLVPIILVFDISQGAYISIICRRFHTARRRSLVPGKTG